MNVECAMLITTINATSTLMQSKSWSISSKACWIDRDQFFLFLSEWSAKKQSSDSFHFFRYLQSVFECLASHSLIYSIQHAFFRLAVSFGRGISDPRIDTPQYSRRCTTREEVQSSVYAEKLEESSCY